MAASTNFMVCFCCACISTSEVGIVETLGKFDHIAEPGLNCFNPCTQGIRGKLSLRVQQIDCRVDSKTKDNVLVEVSVSVHYQVLKSSCADAYYRLSNPHSQIQAYSSNVIRGQVPRHTLDEVFLVRDEMQKALKDELDTQMAKFGFSIVATLITDIDPNNAVKQSLNQINTNARLRVAASYKAESEKIEVIKAAEADAEAKRLSGVGLAEQRKAAIAGLQCSVENFSHSVKDMSSRDIMSLLLMNQYFDAVKDIATHGKGSVVFLPNASSESLNLIEGVMAADAGKKHH